LRENVWRFFDVQYPDGSNPIEGWYQNLSEEARDAFNKLLKNHRKTENPQEWIGFKRFLKGKQLQKERIWEWWFVADGRQYRVFGKFWQGERKQAILLAGCYHKGEIYTPSNVFESACKRSRDLSEGRAQPSEREVKEDI